MSSDEDSDVDEMVGAAANHEGNSSSEEDEPPPAPAPVQTVKLFLQHQKSFYNVPIIDWNNKSVSPDPHNQTGVSRFHRDKERVLVESGERLGQLLANASAWPRDAALIGKPDSLLQYYQICILQGKLNEGDEGLSRVWYLLFSVQGADSDDEYILRPIPKQVYKEIIRVMATNPNMAISTLNKWKADKDNEKAFSPALNAEFVKVESVSAPRTLRVIPEKEKKDKGEKKADKADKADKPEKADPKKSISSLWAKPGSKPAEKPPDKAPDKADKPPDKPPDKPDKPDKPSDKPDKAPDKPSDKPDKAPDKPDKPDKRPSNASAEDAKVLYKKRKLSVVEEHEILVCSSAAAVPFEPPSGATGAKVTIHWQFD